MAIHIADYITWYELNDQVVLIDRRRQKRIRISNIAAELWQRLAHGATCIDLKQFLIEFYDAEAHESAELLSGYLTLMSERELLYCLEGTP